MLIGKTLWAGCCQCCTRYLWSTPVSYYVIWSTSWPWRCGPPPYHLPTWNLCQALDAAFLASAVSLLSHYSDNYWIIDHIVFAVISNPSFWYLESDGGRRGEVRLKCKGQPKWGSFKWKVTVNAHPGTVAAAAEGCISIRLSSSTLCSQSY